MTREETLNTYRLLVELKIGDSVPEINKKDLDRSIFYLEESLKKSDFKKVKLNSEILGTIAAIFRAWLFPP